MTNTRNTRRSRKSRYSERGFTLLEVLAALLIVGTALTYLVSSQAASIERAAGTNALREATMLAAGKMAELASGVETGASGTFEGYEDISWEVSTGPFEGGYRCTRIILTVTYREAGETHQITLEQVTR